LGGVWVRWWGLAPGHRPLADRCVCLCWRGGGGGLCSWGLLSRGHGGHRLQVCAAHVERKQCGPESCQEAGPRGQLLAWRPAQPPHRAAAREQRLAGQMASWQRQGGRGSQESSEGQRSPCGSAGQPPPEQGGGLQSRTDDCSHPIQDAQRPSPHCRRLGRQESYPQAARLAAAATCPRSQASQAGSSGGGLAGAVRCGPRGGRASPAQDRRVAKR
jgi:hypothetical protein